VNMLTEGMPESRGKWIEVGLKRDLFTLALCLNGENVRRRRHCVRT
jgi:hypothetical protein